MNDLSRSGLPAGTLVYVRAAYHGNGRYVPDGTEGLYTVVSHLGRGDYRLARGDHRADPYTAEWDVIVNEARLRPAEVV